MKKQLFLLVMMLLPMVAMAIEVEIDGLWYEIITKTGETKVIKSKNVSYYGNVVIPEKVKYEGVEYSVMSIEERAFCECENLTSVTIPSSVKSIGEGAFEKCSYLNSVTIPNSLTSIGDYIFNGCSSLTSITIPNSVTSIGGHAFFRCSSLTSITIPNSVTSLGMSVFRDCSSLTTVTIGESVTSIGKRSFENCTSLISITIPSGVTSIEYRTLSNCSSLTTIMIPNCVTYIDREAFSGCSALTSVMIPNSVTSIGSSAFSGCSGLTSISIPNSVTSIGSSAFQGCSGLTSVSIGIGVQAIGSKTFAQCPELADMFCYSENVPTTQNDAFEGSLIDYATLHVPEASINAYSQAEPWRNFKEIVGLDGTIPEMQKCATPTIQIVDGKLKLSCETEGVTFVTSYTSDGLSDSTLDDEIVLAGTTTCHVSVYATKAGYENSDVATVDVDLHIGKKGDVNNDGVVDITDAVGVVNIILEKNDTQNP